MTRMFTTTLPALLVAILWNVMPCAPTAIAAEVTEFTVHQESPALASVDIGYAGKSHGDMLAFEAAIYTEDGKEGTLSGLLITVDLPRGKSVFEDRIGNLVFAFGESDSLVVAGASAYAPDATEMKTEHPQIRAVIGGTGTYLGARGQVTTTRNDDGTYDHAFKLID